MSDLQTPTQSVKDALLTLERSGEAPLVGALERAKRIAIFIHDSGFPQPFVFPTKIRGVQFEWHGGKHELDVEIMPDGNHACFVTFIDGRQNTDADAEGGQIEDHLRSLIRWLESK